MRLIDLYNATGIAVGDIMVCTVKVIANGEGGFSVYRCRWPNARIDSTGTPDGDWVGNEELTIEQLIPLIAITKEYKANKIRWEGILDKACNALDKQAPDWQITNDKDEHDWYLRQVLYNELPDEDLDAHSAQIAVDEWRTRCTSPCGETCISTQALEEHLRCCDAPECNGF